MTGRLATVDLDAVDRTGADGVVWALGDGDVNVNVVTLGAGGTIASHVNAEVDVVITVVGGDGVVEVDDEHVDVRPHHLLRVPRGARRAVRAGDAGIVYTTVHRARARLTLAPRR